MMRESFGKSLAAVLPITSSQSMGESPVAGRLVVILSSLKTSPALMSRAATMLLRAIDWFLRSDLVTCFSPEPSATLTLRMEFISFASSFG